jgi:hypothetical protein
MTSVQEKRHARAPQEHNVLPRPRVSTKAAIYGPEVYAAARARGKAEAEKDIKAGHFQVRDWGKP